MRIRLLAPLAIILVVLAAWLGTSLIQTKHAPQPAETASDSDRPDRILPISGRPDRTEIPATVEPTGLDVGQPSDPTAMPQASATLIVLVQDRAAKAPVPYVCLSLWADDANYHDGLTYDEDDNVGDFSDNPLTDASGRAEFHLPAGISSTLAAFGEHREVGILRDISIPALAPGERRNLTVQIQVGYDLHFCGKVVDAKEGTPIAGARVSIQEYGVVLESDPVGEDYQTCIEVVTDADGQFDAQLPSWVELIGRVERAGFGPAVFVAEPGHEQPDRALRVELVEGASIHGTLGYSVNTAYDQFTVRASADGFALFSGPGPSTGFMPLEWEAPVQPDGSWELHDLAAGVRLVVELCGQPERLGERETRLMLVPGERRVLHWEFGPGSTVRGKAVLTDTGEPYGGETLWLLPDGEQHHEGEIFDHWEPAEVALTDRDGNFEFTDVASGHWLVGPAPAGEGYTQSVVPWAEGVVVPPGVEQVDILVDVHRDLYVNGTVEGCDGSDPDFAWVVAERPGLMQVADCGEGGVFSVGPLLPGEYRLFAQSRVCANSDFITASARDEGVVLRLKPGATLMGNVVEADSGAPVDAHVWLSAGVNWGHWRLTGSGVRSKFSGRFSFRGLQPGTYSLSAVSGLLVGTTDNVHVSEGAVVDNVSISLEPGVRVYTRYDGPLETVEVRPSVNGVPFKPTGLDRGRPEHLVLPAGRATLQFVAFTRARETVLGEKTIQLTLGEDERVVWPASKF